MLLAHEVAEKNKTDKKRVTTLKVSDVFLDCGASTLVRSDIAFPNKTDEVLSILS